jgi:hypothetical protein
VEELLTVLKDGGPLGLAAICMIAAAYIYRSKETLRDEYVKEVGTINREHATEVARLNDKRLEDIRAVLAAIGNFDLGRAAIVDAVEGATDAITQNSRVLLELKDKVLEISYQRGAGGPSWKGTDQ